jgi:hypothetical protein
MSAEADRERLKGAADVIDQIATVGETAGRAIGGVGGTITTVVSIGAGIVSAILRAFVDPVVAITRMRSAARAFAQVDADVDAELAKRGVDMARSQR